MMPLPSVTELKRCSIALSAMLVLFFLVLPQQPVAAVDKLPEVAWRYSDNITFLLDKIYGPAPDPDNLYDIYFPDPAVFPGPRPCFVYAHGGGMVSGDKSEGTEFCEELACRGFVAVTTNYTLNGGALPGSGRDEWEDFLEITQMGIDDLRIILRVLRASHATFNINPERFYLGGASAGVGALMHAVLGNPASGVPLPHDYEYVKGLVIWWTALLGPECALHGPTGNPPINYFTPDDPPVCVIHGTDDTHPIACYDAGLEIIRQAEESGVYNRLHPLHGAGHQPWYLEYQIWYYSLEFLCELEYFRRK